MVIDLVLVDGNKYMGLLGLIIKAAVKPFKKEIKGKYGEMQVNSALNPLIFDKVEHKQINNLVLVDYTFENGKIIFDACDEDSFILVQESNMLVQNIMYIILLSVLFALAISSLVAFIVINNKSKSTK